MESLAERTQLKITKRVHFYFSSSNPFGIECGVQTKVCTPNSKLKLERKTAKIKMRPTKIIPIMENKHD